MNVRDLATSVLRDVRRNPEYRVLVNTRNATSDEIDSLVRERINAMNLDATVASQVAQAINPRLAR